MALLTEIRRRVPSVLVLLAGIAWAGLMWQSYNDQLVAPGSVDTEVVTQYYDRELRLLEAGKRGDAFEKWLSGTSADAGWLEDSAETIRKLYRVDLGEDADVLLDSIALRQGEDVVPVEGAMDEGYRTEMREFLLAGHGRAWHFDLYLEAADDADVRKVYQRGNDELLRRLMWSSSTYFALMVAGIACAGLWISDRRKVHLQASRIPDAWPAVSVLGLFFLSEIILYAWLWLVGIGYELYYALGGTAELYALYDLLWRAFPAVFLGVLFLKKPWHIWRIFGLGRRVDWLLVLAGMAVISVVNWVLYYLAPASEIDPTDFLEAAQLDFPGLASLIFSSAIVAPVFEEIVFRGFLFQGLRKKTGAGWAAVISTVLFALTHTQYDMFGWISVGTMGMVACYLTLRTGSLKSAIALHALGNLLITLDVYFHYQHPL
jgi:membrane protease YdiL (CAAX protease family)